MRNRGTRLCAQRGERRCRTRVHGFDGKDRYKAFSGDTFYVAEYDTTYRQLRYNKGYDYLGAEAISYTSGWYRSNYGHITQFKCNYRVYN